MFYTWCGNTVATAATYEDRQSGTVTMHHATSRISEDRPSSYCVIPLQSTMTSNSGLTIEIKTNKKNHATEWIHLPHKAVVLYFIHFEFDQEELKEFPNPLRRRKEMSMQQSGSIYLIKRWCCTSYILNLAKRD